MPRIKDQAVCIRQIDWSETSQIVVLLTKQQGKLRGLAKGSKRQSPSSIQRFSGGIELLNLGEIVATIKPTTELATLTEWDLQQDFYHLRRNLRAQHLAMYAADITHALLGDLDPHPAVFEALVKLLEAMVDESTLASSLLVYQWTLLREVGVQPLLDADVRTGEELADQRVYTFDAEAGGVTMQPGPSEWQVRRQTVALLRQVAQGGGAAGDEAGCERANRLLCVYIRAMQGRELPTMRVVLR